MLILRGIFTGLQFTLGTASLIYFSVYVSRLGTANRFTYFWLGAGIIFLCFGAAGVYDIKNGKHVSRALNITLMVICIFVIAVFFSVLLNIIKADISGPADDAGYCIILGGRVKGLRPSSDLKKRLETGSRYLKEHPECKCIVTGGQGTGEAAPEGRVMRDWLIKNGIDEKRITAEEKSETTYENFMLTAELFKKQGTDIRSEKCVAVSSSYHIYRAMGIARKAGFKYISGLGSEVSALSALNGYAREVFAVIYNNLRGRM